MIKTPVQSKSTQSARIYCISLRICSSFSSTGSPFPSQYSFLLNSSMTEIRSQELDSFLSLSISCFRCLFGTDRDNSRPSMSIIPHKGAFRGHHNLCIRPKYNTQSLPAERTGDLPPPGDPGSHPASSLSIIRCCICTPHFENPKIQNFEERSVPAMQRISGH